MATSGDVRRSLEAAITAMAAMALTMDRVATLLGEWDTRAATSAAGKTWALAAAEVRAAVTPAQDDIAAAVVAAVAVAKRAEGDGRG